MKKIVNEPRLTCRLGQGEECCAFLVVGVDGFECIRMDPMNSIIFSRLEAGTMNAKGHGLWDGCLWEEKGGKNAKSKEETIDRGAA